VGWLKLKEAGMKDSHIRKLMNIYSEYDELFLEENFRLFNSGLKKTLEKSRNINLENIRVKLEASKTGDFIKVSSRENPKDTFVFEKKQEKITPKVEENVQSNINIVKNEEKSTPKKKVVKQELSKDKFLKELKKIFEEN